MEKFRRFVFFFGFFRARGFRVVRAFRFARTAAFSNCTVCVIFPNGRTQTIGGR